MPFDIVALRYVVLTADTSSFARAAAQSGVKQATLSRRIANLEGRLGLQLFDRSTRGAVPTPAAQGFIDVARRIVGELVSLQECGRAIAAGRVGTLGIGYSTSLAAGNIRALVVEFVERHPEVRVIGIEGDRSRLYEALHQRTIDFAVIASEQADSALNSRLLWAERVLAVVPESHPLASRDRIYWPDLRRERIVTARQDPGSDLATLAIARLSEPGFSPDVETREISRENILNLVPVGGFVTLTTDGALGRSVPGVALLEIHDVGGAAIHVDYWGYWRKDNSSAVLARVLKLVADRHPV